MEGQVLGQGSPVSQAARIAGAEELRERIRLQREKLKGVTEAYDLLWMKLRSERNQLESLEKLMAACND